MNFNLITLLDDIDDWIDKYLEFLCTNKKFWCLLFY